MDKNEDPGKTIRKARSQRKSKESRRPSSGSEGCEAKKRPAGYKKVLWPAPTKTENNPSGRNKISEDISPRMISRKIDMQRGGYRQMKVVMLEVRMI